MTKKWSLQEISNKADWEGGIVPLLQWGLSSDMIEDQELSALWKQLEAIEPILEQIQKLLPEPGEGDC